MQIYTPLRTLPNENSSNHKNSTLHIVYVYISTIWLTIIQDEKVKGLFSARTYIYRVKLKKVPLIIEAITPYVLPTNFAYFILYNKF